MIVDVIELSIEGNVIEQKYLKDFKAKLSRIERVQTIDFKLAKKIFRNKPDLFKEDKEISLKICYKDRYDLKEVFKGITSEIHPSKTDVAVKCEDFSRKQKKIINISFTKIWDGEIIKQITDLDTTNVQNRRFFNKVVFNSMSVNSAISYLADKSNSDWFIINEKLYYGEKYSFSNQKEVLEIDLDSPMVVNKESLKWHEGEKDLKVRVIGRDDKGKVYQGIKGKGKNVKKFERPGMGKDSVKDEAEKLYKELTFRGYRGSLKLFADPVVFHSEKVKLIDGAIEREAYIDAVEFSWSLSQGLKMELFVGQEEKEKKKIKLKKRGNRKGRRKKKNKKQGLGYKIRQEQKLYGK